MFLLTAFQMQFVKLNNPLMGTETIFSLIFISPRFRTYVKLNNPLMGTETCLTLPLSFDIEPSKLN